MDNASNWKNWRRQRAIELMHMGQNESEIAKIFGVAQSTVSRWMRSTQNTNDGQDGRARPCQLDSTQKAMLPEFLSHGAEAYGFRGDLWTCARVANVIFQEYGIQYHRRQVGRLLEDLKWTPQKPIIRATQRDEKKILEWKAKVWPSLKKSLGERKKLSFFPMNLAFIYFQGKDELMRPKPIQP